MSQQPNTRLPIGPFSTARPNPTVTLRPRALSSPTHPSQLLPFRTIVCRRFPEPPLPSPSAGSASSQWAQPRRLAYPPPTPLPVLLISCQPYSRTTSMFAKPHTHTHTHNPDADDCARPPPTSALLPPAPNHVRSCAAEAVAGREDDDVVWRVSAEEAKGGFFSVFSFIPGLCFEQKTGYPFRLIPICIDSNVVQPGPAMQQLPETLPAAAMRVQVSDQKVCFCLTASIPRFRADWPQQAFKYHCPFDPTIHPLCLFPFTTLTQSRLEPWRPMLETASPAPETHTIPRIFLLGPPTGG